MSTLFVDTINEKTTNNGVYIPGHVSQMIRAAATPRIAGSISAGTYVDTGLTASITPNTSSSKILVFSQINMNAAAASYHYSKIVRSIGGGSYAVPTGSNASGQVAEYKAASEWVFLNCLIIDEPATTSAITYKVQYKNSASTTWNYGWNSSGGNDNMNALILLEVGG
tara:strand:+ start:588 stop:1091 length:504 start_codon:yes stop_codon:yes gene_type:complete